MEPVTTAAAATAAADTGFSLGLGDVLTAGASLLGGWFSKEGQEDANRTNARIARENREFQKTMSNTAHQREVRDLREAGLNPLLSAMSGGASTPSGSTATMQNTLSDFGHSIAKTPEAVLAVQQAKANVGQTRAQEALVKEQKEATSLKNSLDRLTLEWYKNHPQYAPNVNSGINTATGMAGLVDTVSNYLTEGKGLRGMLEEWHKGYKYLRSKGHNVFKAAGLY